MATITKVTVSLTMLNVFLSDNTVKPFFYTQPLATFLYTATPQQRENWDIQDKGRAVVWPDLGQSLGSSS
ncbi:hypothetical protein H9L05_21365 (plasmid) [Hymenobacter qilianensis]|uniref:DUF2442 domain-containing protein n=1 Tax=Hymenobacter qilianensis TaxID=1385715 RepID=A0A7H0H115_9BACT|nr:hypothetical protein [Hymenobacter qilianensis]QNP54231.1 hypothetical protein H9L05_21365 [Hymenobacter qilianensis]